MSDYKVIKVLDEEGLKRVLSKLAEYPDNTILAAVINAIDEAKQDVIVPTDGYAIVGYNAEGQLTTVPTATIRRW